MKTRISKEWIVEPSEAPYYLNRCNRCRKVNPYYCSEKFRINAQKKSVDVWLIFKCKKCDNTKNIDVLSRVNPKLIDKEEYMNFQYNDRETAWKYAFDADVINKNKARVVWDHIEYSTTGDIMSLEEIQEQEEDLVEFNIRIKYNIELNLFTLIKKNLNLTTSKLEKMLSAGVITIFPPGPVKKAKVADGQQVMVNRKKLIKFLSNTDDNQADIDD